MDLRKPSNASCRAFESGGFLRVAIREADPLRCSTSQSLPRIDFHNPSIHAGVRVKVGHEM
jgi:hypothetical protein